MAAILYVLMALGAIFALLLIFWALRFIVAVLTGRGGGSGYWEQSPPPIEVAPRLEGDFPKSVLELTRRCAEEKRRRILARALSGFSGPEPKQIPTALKHPKADADVTTTYRRKIAPDSTE